MGQQQDPGIQLGQQVWLEKLTRSDALDQLQPGNAGFALSPEQETLFSSSPEQEGPSLVSQRVIADRERIISLLFDVIDAHQGFVEFVLYRAITGHEFEQKIKVQWSYIKSIVQDLKQATGVDVKPANPTT